MANHEYLTDEYVAELLAKDARETSIKYSTMGLRAFASSKYVFLNSKSLFLTKECRPPANKPKPNTRFLRNIIRGTDHHNATLLARETAEARERFLSLPLDGTREAKKKVGHVQNGVERPLDTLDVSNRETREPKAHVNNRDIRKRQLGNIAEILHGRSMKRNKTEEKNKTTRQASTSSHDQEDKKKSRSSRRDAEKSEKSEKVCRAKKSGSYSVTIDRSHTRRASTSGDELEDKKISRSSRKEYDKPENFYRAEKHERSRVVKDRRSTRRASTSSLDQDEKKSRPSRKECERSEKSCQVEKHEASRVIKDRRFKSVLDVLGERKRHEEDRKRRLKSRSPSPRTSSSRKHDKSSHRREHRSGEKEESRHHTRRPHKEPSSRSKEAEEGRDARRKSRKRSEPPEEIDSESDPLEDIIGPQPVLAPNIRPRGRGAISHASEIDRHFSEVYDPSADIQLDFDEENDWDQALEAFRDRQKFKEKGVERLKSAGFTEKEIKRLERGRLSPEKEFKWVMQGQRREWDRGKMIDSEGVLRFESKFGLSANDINNSNYGRLKGT
ncbi:hypothetical protein K3495_g7000 [Podosphaera aphanis]|nr:hypothetical protein K3495_g7000 [Podosphaera aphanis]